MTYLLKIIMSYTLVSLVSKSFSSVDCVTRLIRGIRTKVCSPEVLEHASAGHSAG